MLNVAIPLSTVSRRRSTTLSPHISSQATCTFLCREPKRTVTVSPTLASWALMSDHSSSIVFTLRHPFGVYTTTNVSAVDLFPSPSRAIRRRYTPGSSTGSGTLFKVNPSHFTRVSNTCFSTGQFHIFSSSRL